MTDDSDAGDAGAGPDREAETAHDQSSGRTPTFPPQCDDPATIGAVVARERRTDGDALRAAAPGRSYSYRDFITTSYKAGNVLRYLGVRPGDEVLVVPDALPEPVLAFYGAAQLGAVTRFAETVTDDPPRAVLAPVDRESEFDLPPGHRLAVHGGPPDDPATTHWEAEVWSENPAVHPVDVAGSDPALVADDRTYTHAELLSGAARVAADADLGPGDEMVVRGSLADPEVVVAGLLAPILVGATIVFPAESTEATGGYASKEAAADTGDSHRTDHTVTATEIVESAPFEGGEN